MQTISEIWQKQNLFIENKKKESQELFNRKPLIDDDQTLARIGIAAFPAGRPLAYLRLWPQDFIVEEITKDGGAHLLEIGDKSKLISDAGNTVYADLVKVGLSTLDAVEEISKQFGIERNKIGYAGIKDKDALTCQQLSFRQTDLEVVEGIKGENFFLKNIHKNKGALQIGDLEGNRFTLVLRGFGKFNEEEINNRISALSQTGFFNFFYTQRFGTPRLISHYLGLLMLQRNYEEAIKALLTFTSNAEIAFYTDLRKQIATLWGNWEEIHTLIEPLGYSFRRELLLIEYLEKTPTDFLGALKLIPEQVQMWVFAYASFLFNRKLSEMIRAEKVPVALPLLLSGDQSDWELYRDFLEADDLKIPSPMFRDFPQIQVKSRAVKTVQGFKFDSFKIVPDQPKIGVISFTLPKGSYATTLLAHLFSLAGNIPVPEGISDIAVDSKEVLGYSAIAPMLEIFKTSIHSKLEFSESQTETSAE